MTQTERTKTRDPLKDLEEALNKAVGEELRRVREGTGLSRVHFSMRLPSRIGDRTLLAYEHGLRMMTLARLVELADALCVDPATIFRRGLQRARINVANMTLDVELNELIKDCESGSAKFRSLRIWARNALNENPAGVATIEVAAVRSIAQFIGCPQQKLAEYLARFTPPPFAPTYDEPEPARLPLGASVSRRVQRRSDSQARPGPAGTT